MPANPPHKAAKVRGLTLSQRQWCMAKAEREAAPSVCRRYPDFNSRAAQRDYARLVDFGYRLMTEPSPCL